MKLTIFIFLFLVTQHCVSAMSFTRCELVKELKLHNFEDLRTWVCVIEAESGRNTNIVSRKSNGSHSWGLFQINDAKWCTVQGPPGNNCNVNCKNLATNNITQAATCAKKIHKLNGFRLWIGWHNNCATGELPNLSKCDV